MGYHSAVVGVLALAALASASVGDNTLDSGERVVLVSPVLAPFQDSKVQSTVRARQFPILVLLAQRNPEYSREPQAKSLERSSQPIYVQKLEDQEQTASAPRQLNRQRRHLFKKHFGISYGGQQQPVYQQPVYQQQPVYVPQPVYHQQPAYNQPPQTIVVNLYDKQKYGGYGGHGGGGHGGGGHGGGGHGSPCGGGCGGGGGGGYGGGHAYASATATASAQSFGGGYRKK